jgi:SAM-dependent methyltransferase
MRRLNPLTESQTQVRKSKYSKDPWIIVECLETGMVYLENPPDYSQLSDEYAYEKSYGEEKERRRRDEPAVSCVSHAAHSLVRLFVRREKIEVLSCGLLIDIHRKHGAQGALRLLDVGCGSGVKLQRVAAFLKKGRDASVIPLGIDVSKQMAASANRTLAPLGGMCINAAAIDGMNSVDDDSIDLVTMCAYLEHETKPLEALRACRRKLRDDGFVVIKVPNYACINRKVRQNRWCAFCYPDHVNYFTPKTLREMIRRSGMEVVRMSFLDTFPLNDNMYVVARRQQRRAYPEMPAARDGTQSQAKLRKAA